MLTVWIVLAVLGAALVLAAGAALLWWKTSASDDRRLARRLAKLRLGDKLALAGALFRDRRVPLLTRAVAVLLVLYLASPLDILPDFLPGIGYLDDILIVMAGGAVILRTIPRAVLEEQVSRLEERRRAAARRPEEARR